VRVRVAGRMLFKRVMGKASFAKLQDSSGQIQVYLQSEALAAAYDEFKAWDVGDIVAAHGVLMRTRAGELSVRAESVRLLVKALRPLPDKWHGLADTEARYRQRYVDLIINSEARQVFETRTRIVRFLRDFLDAQGFLEVETPMMQPIPGGAVARPFVTHHNALGQDMYLRIAPELYLKRLVVGGFERVYEINRNFRNEGLSTQHNPEFTMLELYQAYADCADFMGLVERMMQGLALAVASGRSITYQGRAIDFATPFARQSVEEAVAVANPDLDRARLRDASYLGPACARLGIEPAKDDGAGALLLAIFEKTCERGLLQPTFIHSYPTEVSPLSRRRDSDPFVTDRFEFFVDGRELANGFLGAERPRGPGRALSRAGPAPLGRRPRGDVLRCRLHPRARVRDAARGRARRRDRPARHAADGFAQHPGRPAVPATAAPGDRRIRNRAGEEEGRLFPEGPKEKGVLLPRPAAQSSPSGAGAGMA
jgi:lysyl-tRNA synthetase class 2